MDVEGQVPDRVPLRSVGEEEARDDLLVEGFVEVEGDLVRPSLITGNASMTNSEAGRKHESREHCATSASGVYELQHLMR